MSLIKFSIEITDHNENTIFKLDNQNQNISFELSFSRGAYEGSSFQIPTLRLNNIISPFISDKLLIKKAKADLIKIRGGYESLEDIVNGYISIYRTDPDNLQSLEIIFLEAGTPTGELGKSIVREDSKLDFFERIAKPNLFKGEQTVLDILKQVYGGEVVANSKIKGIYNKKRDYKAGRIGETIYELCNENNIRYFYYNKKLILFDLENPIKILDLTRPFQLKTNAILEATNPYLILEDLNYDKKVNRMWRCSTIFNPFIMPSLKVKASDKRGEMIEGIIGQVFYYLSNEIGENQIKFIEFVNEGVK